MAEHRMMVQGKLRVAVLLFAMQPLAGGLGAAAQQPTPPKPAQPSSVLRMPPAVRQQGVPGQASLPQELKLGFALDMGDTIRGGNWDVTATVTAIHDRVVTLKTSSAVGHMVYRLPPGLDLRLAPNQQVVIKREVIGRGASFGYALTVTSNSRLLLASGRVVSDSQLSHSIVPGVAVVQRTGERVPLKESQYETIFQVPADLLIDGSPLRLVAGQAVGFSRGGVDYQAVLTHSSETTPAKRYEGVAEGSPFAVEYVITIR